MKNSFGVGFGWIFGIYAAMLAINVVDKGLPKEYRVFGQKQETKQEEEAQVSSFYFWDKQQKGLVNMVKVFAVGKCVKGKVIILKVGERSDNTFERNENKGR